MAKIGTNDVVYQLLGDLVKKPPEYPMDRSDWNGLEVRSLDQAGVTVRPGAFHDGREAHVGHVTLDPEAYFENLVSSILNYSPAYRRTTPDASVIIASLNGVTGLNSLMEYQNTIDRINLFNYRLQQIGVTGSRANWYGAAGMGPGSAVGGAGGMVDPEWANAIGDVKKAQSIFDMLSLNAAWNAVLTGRSRLRWQPIGGGSNPMSTTRPITWIPDAMARFRNASFSAMTDTVVVPFYRFNVQQYQRLALANAVTAGSQLKSPVPGLTITNPQAQAAGIQGNFEAWWPHMETCSQRPYAPGMPDDFAWGPSTTLPPQMFYCPWVGHTWTWMLLDWTLTLSAHNLPTFRKGGSDGVAPLIGTDDPKNKKGWVGSKQAARYESGLIDTLDRQINISERLLRQAAVLWAAAHLPWLKQIEKGATVVDLGRDYDVRLDNLRDMIRIIEERVAEELHPSLNIMTNLDISLALNNESAGTSFTWWDIPPESFRNLAQMYLDEFMKYRQAMGLADNNPMPLRTSHPAVPVNGVLGHLVPYTNAGEVEREVVCDKGVYIHICELVRYLRDRATGAGTSEEIQSDVRTVMSSIGYGKSGGSYDDEPVRAIVGLPVWTNGITISGHTQIDHRACLLGLQWVFPRTEWRIDQRFDPRHVADIPLGSTVSDSLTLVDGIAALCDEKGVIKGNRRPGPRSPVSTEEAGWYKFAQAWTVPEDSPNRLLGWIMPICMSYGEHLTSGLTEHQRLTEQYDITRQLNKHGIYMDPMLVDAMTAKATVSTYGTIPWVPEDTPPFLRSDVPADIVVANGYVYEASAGVPGRTFKGWRPWPRAGARYQQMCQGNDEPRTYVGLPWSLDYMRAVRA